MNDSSEQIKDSTRIFISEGKAPYVINAELINVGDDIVCILTGGTHAHTGAVSFAEPSASTHPVTGAIIERGEEPIVRTLVGEGHKDALPAEMYAKALCKHYNANIVCTSGIHVDNASKDEIEIMMNNITLLLKRLLEVKI